MILTPQFKPVLPRPQALCAWESANSAINWSRMLEQIFVTSNYMDEWKLYLYMNVLIIHLAKKNLTMCLTETFKTLLCIFSLIP